MTSLAVAFPGDTLIVQPWPDTVVDPTGHDPRSPYVEQFWLAVLGPSTTWLLRYFAALFDRWPDGFEINLDDTARSIGLRSLKSGSAASAYLATNSFSRHEKIALAVSLFWSSFGRRGDCISDMAFPLFLLGSVQRRATDNKDVDGRDNGVP